MTLTILDFSLFIPIVLAAIAYLVSNKKLKKLDYPALNRATININILYLIAIICFSLYSFYTSGLLHPPYILDFETIFPFVMLIVAILLCVLTIFACLRDSKKGVKISALLFNIIAALHQLGILLFVLSSDIEEIMRNTGLEGAPVVAGGLVIGMIIMSWPVFWNVYAIFRVLGKMRKAEESSHSVN